MASFDELENQRQFLMAQLQGRMELLHKQQQIIDAYGWRPMQGYSQPIEGLPPMTNAFWQDFQDVMTQLTTMEGKPIRGSADVQRFIQEHRPASDMKWQSFTFGADTSGLTRHEKGKLTRLFNQVTGGKKPLSKLVEYMDELGMEFDYEEFRHSYSGD